MAIDVNGIPRFVLGALGTRQAVVRASADLADEVLASATLAPEDLRAVEGLEALARRRCEEGVFAITLTVLRLDEAWAAEATRGFSEPEEIERELCRLAAGEVYVAYVVTHFNPEQRPFGPLTVNIGGDCYRTGKTIRDLESILARTRDLAQAMLRKSVMIFPDIPALHGGKKGEWIVVDRDGRKLEEISEGAIVALGSVVIPMGIGFLNAYKEAQARRLGLFEAFPAHNYIRPDSGSPDVLSGIYWRGERQDKPINLCEIWHGRQVDLSQITCLPDRLGGTLDPSARATGYGVATTTAELARRAFAPAGRSLEDLHFLLEAAGGVGRNTIEALVERFGVPAERITVFDRSAAAADAVAGRYGVEAVVARHADFYRESLPALVEAGRHFDIWVNNGEGDNTAPGHVEALLGAGVRVFTGGANNFLRVAEEEASLARIFGAGAWAWPDAATSGGGWTLAVIDILTRCQGRRSNTDRIREAILEIITTRNRRLVSDVLSSLPPQVSGGAIWDKVEHVIESRVERTLSLELAPPEVLAGADTTGWNLA